MRAAQTLVLLATLVVSTAACHGMRFQVSHSAATAPVEDRKTFLFWSLYPTQVVQVNQICPDGVSQIVEETRFSDVMLALVTLGIYTPRTSWYYCRIPPAPPTASPDTGGTP